jgi:hypothetical protein
MKEVLPKQFIRVSYEPHSRFAWISKLMSNPRVTVPVIAIGGTILSYLLIDPVRLLNVVRTLTRFVFLIVFVFCICICILYSVFLCVILHCFSAIVLSLLIVFCSSTHDQSTLIEGEIPSTPESEALANSLANPPTGAGILLVGSPEAREIALDKVTRARWFVISINLTPEGEVCLYLICLSVLMCGLYRWKQS